MAATKAKPAKKPKKSTAAVNGVPVTANVLTLAEAAAYLRVAEDDVVRLVYTQDLSGRKIGDQWRFLKSSLENWLSKPARPPGNEALLALAGSWKDDPYVDEMLTEIYKQRGRPMIEEEE